MKNWRLYHSGYAGWFDLKVNSGLTPNKIITANTKSEARALFKKVLNKSLPKSVKVIQI